MPVLYGKPTSPQSVLEAIRTQIALAGGFSDEYVYPSMCDDDELSLKPPAEKFVVIRPDRFTARAAEQAGGAEGYFGDVTFTHLPVDARFTVKLFVRLETDLDGRDADYLADQTNGVWAVWRRVLKSLEQYSPLFGQSFNCILIQPARIEWFDVKPRKRRSGWGELNASLWAPFVYDLSA